MRKQELIHLHRLLAEVRKDCIQSSNITIDTTEYESLETNTASIHRSKEQHREAVLALSDAITDELPVEEPALMSATSN